MTVPEKPGNSNITYTFTQEEFDKLMKDLETIAKDEIDNTSRSIVKDVIIPLDCELNAYKASSELYEEKVVSLGAENSRLSARVKSCFKGGMALGSVLSACFIGALTFIVR